ncbi:MAG: CpsD/CapB family tyrosine-protein kinase [Actinobacteria bacterium]|nr:CpsD/CapB family tyrosine-protein kinase [Actinomycetota bacterium]
MDFDVLVIDDVSSVLSPRLVHRLQGSGRVVLGVFDADRRAAAKDRLVAVGVDAVIASDAAASEFVRAVVDVAKQPAVDAAFEGIVEELGPPVAEPVDAPAAARRPATRASRGRVVVVAGSDGVTEVAVGLAKALVGRRVSTVIVDMDTLEPSIAQRLGLRLTPNIFTATEQLRLRSSLEAAFVIHSEGFAVIAGIPNPREWENLSEGEATDLVTELATGFDTVVVKLNRHLEDLSTFAGVAGRFDVGRRLVTLADAVVAVASPSPLGTTRLLVMGSDVRRLTRAPIHVVVNQAPSSPFVQGEIAEELARTMAPTSTTFLPADARIRKASWQGEVVRAGAFMRRLGKLADRFVLPKKRGSVTGDTSAVSTGEAPR